MADISSINVQISTANQAGAGTSGLVFLGLCGREFRLETFGNNFKKGAQDDFALGQPANVKEKAINDPVYPQLRTENVDTFPAYIRFDPAGANPKWVLKEVHVTVNTGSQAIKLKGILNGPLTLGDKSGKFLFLVRE
jgi:hypothetical protein